MRALKEDRQITQAELRNMYAPNVSMSTIDCYLHQNNYRKWLAKKRPKLEDRHVFQKLQWALQHKDWTHEQWEGVIWSDECSVEKSDSGRQMWVFRQPPQKWFKDCIAPKRKCKGISLMVRGCFWGRNQGTFCLLIVKSVNKSVYVKLLEYLLLPVLKRIQDTLEDSIFQQDNAPVHKAAVVMDFFKKYNIQVEDWPPYSPDFNPIKHVWVALKCRLVRKYPHIGNAKGDPDKVKARLAEVLPKIWQEIPQLYFEKLWKSMPTGWLV
jgi:transposase